MMPDGAAPIDPDIVAGRIAMLLNDGRSGAVKPLLAALEKLSPDHEDLALLRSSYCCQVQDFGQALRVLEDAIARAPANPMLHLRRAEILFGQADYGGAAANAAEAIVLAPKLTRAKSVLGLALLKLQEFDAALPCLEESFAADPAGVDVALALAALAPEHTIEILLRAIDAVPQLTVLRNALTRRYLCVGNTRQAMRNAVQTREDGLADAETFCLLAFAQMQEAAWEDATFSAKRALRLAPGNAWAMRLTAALAGRGFGQVAPLPRQDAAAAEQELIAGGTILPGTFRSLLQESRCNGKVLDLLCGTGLNAIAAQDVCPGPWTGVDSDPAYLKLCGERGLYDRLELCSQLEFFGTETQYSVILLNEALANAESLQSWFSMLRASLAADGIAFAAIPTGRPGLTGHALFAHHLEDVAEQAERTGLSFKVERAGILRRIEGLPLYGVIASLGTR